MARIAVIGAGISGMAAAYFLSRKHEVSLFEKEDRLGGHTHTHQLQTSVGMRAIDTGFIVYNEKTYPNLTRLFRELGIETMNSDMSFGSVPASNFSSSASSQARRFSSAQPPRATSVQTTVASAPSTSQAAITVSTTVVI